MNDLSVDNLDLRGWRNFVLTHSDPCGCGHPKWEHTGLREPGCSHLGTCACQAFASQTKESAA